MAKKKITKKKSVAKKLDNLNQVDGKSEKKIEPSTLDQVWGDDGMSKYKTLDVNTYEQVVDGMSKADLKNEAIRVGLLPVDNSEQLKIRLLREFSAHVSSYNRPVDSSRPKLEASDEALKILGEGR